MPELAEVLSISKALNKLYAGKWLEKIVIQPFAKDYETFPEVKTLPWLCVGVHYRSKRIYFEMLPLHQKKPVYLFSFLGMTGRWVTQELNHTCYELHFETTNLNRSIDSSEDMDPNQNLDSSRVTDVLYYDDMRKIGFLKLYSFAELTDYFNSVGPDFYLDDVSLEYFTEKQTRFPKKQVVEFLMDTNISTGIGNYLKAEILYYANVMIHKKGKDPLIMPDDVVGDLSETQTTYLHQACHYIIQDAVNQGGYSMSDYLLPDLSIGEYVPLVYNRSVGAFGGMVKKDTFKDKRTTHYITSFD